MKQLHITPHKVMIALLVGIIAVPLTSTALFIQQDSLPTMNMDAEDLRSAALQDRSRIRAQTRLYWNAITQFQKLTEEQGIDVKKPDFNDTSTFDVHGSAPEEDAVIEDDKEVSSLTTDQLEWQDRSLLRRYTRAGFCPEGLRDFYIPGYYELCNALIDDSRKRMQPVTGLLNHNAYLYRALRRAAPNTDVTGWKLRQRMIDEAYNGERRDGGATPGRPVTCTMNPDCLTPRYSD
ncbi:MAG: hypothetical protein KC680_01205 [Candidatus Peregrinibacteria bacterium]|nr:hypothetical protein [Candidatus Peregrinibacteria bacterium]MCB9808237.1 hypothetical protein [Candidatus Peribacteria bacterium]